MSSSRVCIKQDIAKAKANTKAITNHHKSKVAEAKDEISRLKVENKQ